MLLSNLGLGVRLVLLPDGQRKSTWVCQQHGLHTLTLLHLHEDLPHLSVDVSIDTLVNALGQDLLSFLVIHIEASLGALFMYGLKALINLTQDGMQIVEVVLLEKHVRLEQSVVDDAVNGCHPVSRDVVPR